MKLITESKSLWSCGYLGSAVTFAAKENNMNGTSETGHNKALISFAGVTVLSSDAEAEQQELDSAERESLR